MRLISKIYQRFEEKGLASGAKSLLKDAGRRVVDRNRQVILMSLDLGNPKAHPQAHEKTQFKFDLRAFDHETYPKVVEMLERSEPWRIDAMKVRLEDKTPGFVALEEGRVVAFLFYEENTPNRSPQRDLEWLGIELGDKEAYCFDSFVPEELRGRGIAIQRAVYEQLHERGFKTARGYVYSWNTAPLWSYRVMGWKEEGRIVEHRIGNRYAVVGKVLYRLNRFDRTRVMGLPF